MSEALFHPGELAIQRRLGVEAVVAAKAPRSIRDGLTEQHRAFFPRLPMIFLGAVDKEGAPVASLRMARPGFVAALDPQRLRIAAPALTPDGLREGEPVALLGVDFPTRRRNRALGVAASIEPEGFTLRVRQTMGLCAKYIQGREAVFAADGRASPTSRAAERLDGRAARIVRRADCFFIASHAPPDSVGEAGGPDISHRGGRPGFVRVDDAATLTAPDFVGNFQFNTLGNILAEPRVGLLFVDFDSGDVVQIAARAEIVWSGGEVAAFAGAERLVRFHIRHVLHVEGALPARFSTPDSSPFLEATGTWSEATAGG